MKREIATGILVIMFAGLITNGLAMWKEVGVMENRVKTVETRADKAEDTMDSLQSKIEDIHYVLIESKGIKVNRRAR
jgi:hypothetical protein